MNTIVNSLVNVYRRFETRRTLAQARYELLDHSDRQLADIGVSRELLQQGVQAWPWRVAADGTGQPLPEPVQSHRLSRREIDHAVAELNAYSDAELDELDLRRSEIRHAVRYGRPGYPNDLSRAA